MEVLPWWVPVVSVIAGAVVTGGVALVSFHAGAQLLAKLIPGSTIEPIIAKALEQFAGELKEAVGQNPTPPPA